MASAAVAVTMEEYLEGESEVTVIVSVGRGGQRYKRYSPHTDSSQYII